VTDVAAPLCRSFENTCVMARNFASQITIFARSWAKAPADYYDFSVLNSLMSHTDGRERSATIEYLLPKNLALKFANSEITNQELIDKGQVLVNGVRIALNLQTVE
jgi:hypothetical protein